MAKDLYSAAMTAGKTASAYSKTLSDVSGASDTMAHIQRKAAMDLHQQSQQASLIGSALELGSTIHGGWQDKKDFEMKSGLLEKEHGRMTEVKRSFWDTVMGAPKQYTFGEGKDSLTFSKSGVLAQGGQLAGEGISMYDEAGIGGGNIDSDDDVKKIPKVTKSSNTSGTSQTNKSGSSSTTGSGWEPPPDLTDETGGVVKTGGTEDDDLNFTVDELFKEEDWGK